MSKHQKTKEYFDQWQGVKLSDSSRARIESNLIEYARFHGVRVEEDARSIGQVPRRTSFITTIFNLNKKSMTAALLAIVLIAGGGTSYAAEGAVPGDFLYPVKAGLNENVKSALAISNEAEAELQVRLAKERLEEAEELAARGELSAEASVDLSNRLKKHYNEAEERSERAEAEGSYESSATVRASLEGTFRTYADILSNLNISVSGNDGALLISEIKTYADTAANAQATATIEKSADVQADVEATINQAEDLIADVAAKLTRAQTKISSELYVQSEAKLDQSVEFQTEAKAHLKAGLYRNAYLAVQAAIRTAAEAEAMIDSALRLNIDVDLGVGATINDVLDVRIDTNTGADNSDQSTEAGSGTDLEDRGEGTGTSIEAGVDTTVDTDVIDAEVEIDTSIRSNSGLNL